VVNWFDKWELPTLCLVVILFLWGSRSSVAQVTAAVTGTIQDGSARRHRWSDEFVPAPRFGSLVAPVRFP
jgi:hypothetical protein